MPHLWLTLLQSPLVLPPCPLVTKKPWALCVIPKFMYSTAWTVTQPLILLGHRRSSSHAAHTGDTISCFCNKEYISDQMSVCIHQSLEDFFLFIHMISLYLLYTRHCLTVPRIQIDSHIKCTPTRALGLFDLGLRHEPSIYACIGSCFLFNDRCWPSWREIDDSMTAVGRLGVK